MQPMMAVCRVRRSRLRSASAAGQRIGVGVVVGEDQHTIGIAKVVLILLDLLPRHRAGEFRDQRTAQQFRQRERVDVGEVGAERLGLLHLLRPRAEHVDQRAAGADHGIEDPAQARGGRCPRR